MLAVRMDKMENKFTVVHLRKATEWEGQLILHVPAVTAILISFNRLSLHTPN
jgi:hypothetical protein